MAQERTTLTDLADKFNNNPRFPFYLMQLRRNVMETKAFIAPAVFDEVPKKAGEKTQLIEIIPEALLAMPACRLDKISLARKMAARQGGAAEEKAKLVRAYDGKMKNAISPLSAGRFTAEKSIPTAWLCLTILDEMLDEQLEQIDVALGQLGVVAGPDATVTMLQYDPQSPMKIKEAQASLAPAA